MREFCPRPTRHISLCDALDRLLNTGVVALGELTLSVADVDLIYLGLQLVVTSIEGGRQPAPAHAGPQPGPIPWPPNPNLNLNLNPNPNPTLILRDGPAPPGPQPGPNSRGCPRPNPSEERPTSQTVRRPPSAALPLPLARQAGSLPSGALGEETELVANATADSNRKKNGLGQLVLTLMKLLHELLQRQALRRIEGGALTPAQVERLGVTLMNQAREIERLRNDFGLPEEDLNLDLGPLGKLL